MEITSITIIRGIAAGLLLIAFFMCVSHYKKTKRTTDIWMLIGVALLIATVESVANALEWANIHAATMDALGEYLSIAFSIVWIYIAFRFMSVGKSVK